MLLLILSLLVFFFFNDTATTEIYTLSLHDALPIFLDRPNVLRAFGVDRIHLFPHPVEPDLVAGFGMGKKVNTIYADRKSTRLNSSHLVISYAVFCLKKKKTNIYRHPLLTNHD